MELTGWYYKDLYNFLHKLYFCKSQKIKEFSVFITVPLNSINKSINWKCLTNCCSSCKQNISPSSRLKMVKCFGHNALRFGIIIVFFLYRYLESKVLCPKHPVTTHSSAIISNYKCYKVLIGYTKRVNRSKLFCVFIRWLGQPVDNFGILQH